MKIESYDPFHIGIKLNPAVLTNTLRSQLLNSLKDSGFDILAKSQPLPNVRNEDLAIKNDTRIQLSYEKHALNTIGKNPKDTTEIFKGVLDLIVKIGYEIKAFAPQFEILINMNIITEKNPTQIINNTVKCNLDSWKELDSNVNVDGLKVTLVDEKFGKQSLQIFLAPNPVRPTTTIILGIQYMNIDKDEIIDFNNKIEDRALRFVKSLGE